MATLVFVKTLCILIVCNLPLITVRENEISITRLLWPSTGSLKSHDVLRIQQMGGDASSPKPDGA
jgi:hypothetical protein